MRLARSWLNTLKALYSLKVFRRIGEAIVSQDAVAHE